jgi:hypothetical protein
MSLRTLLGKGSRPTRPRPSRHLSLTASASRPAPWLTEPLEPRVLLAAPIAAGPEFVVNAQIAGSQGAPAVAADNHGNFVVVWSGQEATGSFTDVFGRRFSADGAPLGGEFPVNVYTAGNQGRPDVAMDADGDFVVVWQSQGQDTSGYGVYARRFSSAGEAVGGEISVNNYKLNNQRNPAVAMNDAGRWVVAWESEAQASPDSGWDVYARRFTPDGVALGGETAVPQSSANFQVEPAVAVAANGDFVVAWKHQPNAIEGSIYVRRFNAFGSPQAEQRVSVGDSFSDRASQPAIAMNAPGNFVVVWRSEIRFDWVDIIGRRYDAAGAPLGDEFSVLTAGLTKSRPSVAMDDDGDFVVAWDDGGDEHGTSFASALSFDAAGTRQGNSFQLNTTTAGDQTLPDVAMDPFGNFVAVWESDDASSRGIFAQRYAHPGSVSGGVFHDRDADGVKEPVDEGLGNWTVYSDTNNNAQRDPGEPWTTSDAGGGYLLGKLPIGGHSLRVVPQTGWEPSIAPVNVTLTQAQQAVAGQNLGVFQRGSLGGVKFHDLDADGTRDPGETGLPGWTIYVDENSDEQFDSGNWAGLGSASGRRNIPPAILGGPGLTESEFVVHPGSMAGVITDLDIFLQVTHPILNQLLVVLLSPSGTPVVLFSPGMLAGANMEASFDDQAQLSLAEGVAPYMDTYRPQQPLAAVNGQSATGRWVVRVLNFSNATGTIRPTFGFTMTGEPRATTDAAGNYTITAVRPGSFPVREVQQAGWVQTAPQFGFHAVALTSGQQATGLDFGNASEFRVNTTTERSQFAPSVASDDHGNTVVAWMGWGPGGVFGVFAQRYSAAGLPVEGEFRVDTLPFDEVDTPDVAMDADGNFVITWAGWLGEGADVYARRYSAMGMPHGDEFRVNTTTTDRETDPSVAMDADGDFVVAWDSRDEQGRHLDVYAQRYSAGGLRRGGEFSVNTTTAGGQGAPSAAMDADGDFVIAWQSRDQDGSGSGVYAQRYGAAGLPRGSEFRVNTTTQGEQAQPDVAMDADGDFLVAWDGPSGLGASYGVYAQRYSAFGAALDGELTISPAAGGSASVAMGDHCGFIIAWSSEGGVVVARRFTPSALPRGPQFQVNTITAGNRGSPVVATDADGDFIVAWDSAVPGDADIAARRFDVPESGPVNFTSFTDARPWTLNGAARLVDVDGDGATDRLRLTDASENPPSSAVLAEPRHAAGFTASFDFQVTDSIGADGFTFVLHNDPHGSAAVGGGGGALGYEGILNSVALKFDFFPGVNQTGLYTNGAPFSDDPADPRNREIPAYLDLDGEQVLRVTISYDPCSYELVQTIDDVDNPATAPFTATYTIDLASVLGDECAYVGFTGATGGLWARQEVLNFAYDPTPPPAPGRIDVPMFFSRALADELQLNGSAALVDTDRNRLTDRLRLTDNVENQSGSGFFTDRRHIDDGFTAIFDFQVTESGGADGFAFVLHNDPRGVAALGAGGGGLGYMTITKSVAVKFDMWPGINQTGLYTNGDQPMDDPADPRNREVPAAFDIDGGSVLRVTLSYDPDTARLTQTVDDLDNPATAPFLTSYVLDLEEVLGDDCAYVGFTGGTGSVVARQEILNFWYDPAPAPQVAQVYVNGTGWAQGFRDFLQAGGLGSVDFGYAIPPTDVLHYLPWSNINKVSLRFDRDVQGRVGQTDLSLKGVKVAQYLVTAFTYDPASRTATWTLDKPIANFTSTNRQTADVATLGLSQSLGGFGAVLHVIPGDANRSGTVSPQDIGFVRSGAGRSTTDQGTSPRHYTIFKDVNGSGTLTPTDLGVVRGNNGADIGPLLASPPPLGARRSASVTAELFADGPPLG